MTTSFQLPIVIYQLSMNYRLSIINGSLVIDNLLVTDNRQLVTEPTSGGV